MSKKTKVKSIKLTAEPFILTDIPAYPSHPLGKPVHKSSRGKSIEPLTNLARSAIMPSVRNLTRKGKKMKTTKTKTAGKRDAVKSIAWLVETSFRAFVGWVLLANFDHLVTTAAALYALGTAAVIVATHFYKAYK